MPIDGDYKVIEGIMYQWWSKVGWVPFVGPNRKEELLKEIQKNFDKTNVVEGTGFKITEFTNKKAQ